MLCIAGICISALIFLVSLCLRNPHLGDEQFLANAEGFRALPEDGAHSRGFAKSENHSDDGTTGARGDEADQTNEAFRNDKVPASYN